VANSARMLSKWLAVQHIRGICLAAMTNS
jgi:hypothetical protein